MRRKRKAEAGCSVCVATKVPRPCRRTTRFSSTSASSALRRVPGATWKRAASSSSLGGATQASTRPLRAAPCLAQLEAGEWKPGEAIPSELELAARFQVAPGTLRKALDALVLENLVCAPAGPRNLCGHAYGTAGFGLPLPAHAPRRWCGRISGQPPDRCAAGQGLGVDVARLLALGVGEPGAHAQARAALRRCAGGL